jgi:hypothetical protein
MQASDKNLKVMRTHRKKAALRSRDNRSLLIENCDSFIWKAIKPGSALQIRLVSNLHTKTSSQLREWRASRLFMGKFEEFMVQWQSITSGLCLQHPKSDLGQIAICSRGTQTFLPIELVKKLSKALNE